VLSVGADNRHGHPHVETLDVLDAMGVGLHRTDRDGTVRIAVRRG
jgi:beta-lactamase superfamily II metal-dependent hydrolase